jgi:beta-glucosidase
VTGSGRPIAPEFLGTALDEIAARYGDALPPVILTAIGASFADAVTFDPEDGDRRVQDGARIDYLAAHLDAALDATSESAAGSRPAAAIDLRGLFVRSLLDGFEWAAGYTQRFGLVRVDFEEFTRTPKDSYRWLQLLAEAR